MKKREFNTKLDDSKSSRMVMIGWYSKGTNGQIYTSSSIIKYILLMITKNITNYINFEKYQNTEAKVCMTMKRKTTYPSVIWWHIRLARHYMRNYKYVQL